MTVVAKEAFLVCGHLKRVCGHSIISVKIRVMNFTLLLKITCKLFFYKDDFFHHFG